MNSYQLSYPHNIQQLSKPNIQKTNYYSFQPEAYQKEQNFILPQEVYQTNYETYNQQEDNNDYNQYNNINALYQENILNQINSMPLTNIEEQRNISNEYLSNNEPNMNYQINNNIDYKINLNNDNKGTQFSHISEKNNPINSAENKMIVNNKNDRDAIILESSQNQANSDIQNIKVNPQSLIENTIQVNNSPLNQNDLASNEEINNNTKNKLDNSFQKSESPNKNEINQEQMSSKISQINPSNLDQSISQQDERKMSSPKLINPLDSNIIINQNEGSIHSKEEKPEKEIQQENLIEVKIENYDYDNDNLKKEEVENILRNNEEFKKKLFDFKSHFDLALTKEENNFFYKKVHKVITPLLGHYEIPQYLEYKSPLLSPNQKFLACIGTGITDWVFVWEMSNLYWYKYKFSYTKVDCIAFTPDSKNIIIVYKKSNPLMYDLSTGKMKLKFEKNGEEDNREGYQYSFTSTNTHFSLASTKSYTMWSIRNGKIRQKITDDSPVKIITSEYLINIDSNLNCVIKKIFDQSILTTFQIKGISTPDEILDGRCTDDMANFVYVIKNGIIIYNFKNREYKGLQRFEYGVDRATLSYDGRYVMKTNMKNLCINDLEKETNVLTILKENFKDYKIDFYSKKIITIDNISITIRDLFDENPQEKQVWLNKNPTKFKEIKFNKDFTILFARIDYNNVVAYDLKTGYIIKKWQNFEENWLDYAITHCGGDRIASKSNLLLIKVWNFINKKEESTFYGYNSYSFCFSGDGNYLLCGAKSGPEVARIWDIDEQKYASYIFNGSNDNIKTKVHLTSPKPKRIICCSVNQEPLIFNSYTKELLYKCECPFKFKEIFDIQSDYKNDVFIIKGRDNERKNMGIMYKLSDGSILQTFENYTTFELVKTKGIFLITKCDNINGGKLCSIDFKSKEEQIFHDFEIQTNKCELINDQKIAVIQYGDELSKEFNLIDIRNGRFIGKINFTKNIGRNCETYITVDDKKNEILFRYFEFLSPEETMAYLKKNVFVVEGENSG